MGSRSDVSKWRLWFSRRRREEDLDRELHADLELEAEERRDAGESPDEARYAARRAFGNPTLIKEGVRTVWGWMPLERLGQDLRYAARALQRNPGFAAVTILSLALGIGANSAIFSVLNAVLLRSLPVPKPEELSIVRLQTPASTGGRFSYPMFERLRGVVPVPENIAAMSRVARVRTLPDGTGQIETSHVQLVSGEYFSMLGLAPALGRTLTAEDNRVVGGHPVAVVSHGYWRRNFGAAPDILGRGLTLNGSHFTIVGVGPPGFSGVWLESPVDAWIPVMMQADVRYMQNFSSNGGHEEKPWAPQEGILWLDFIVREGPSSGGAVSAAINVAFQQTVAREAEGIGDPAERRLFLDRSLVLEPFGRGLSNLRERFAGPLAALMAMVALVLLIACANAANLLLARAAGRQREIAVRLSIGAGRRRLIQQLLTESFLLVAIATAIGLSFAHWAGDLLVRMTIEATGPTPIPVGVDARVLGFTILLSLATGVLFGLAPAFRTTRVELAPALKATARNVHGGSRLSPAKLLVASQLALSLLLVAGAGLFARSLHNFMRLDLGFDRVHVLTVGLEFGASGYPLERLPGIYQRLVERVEAVPGVRSAAVAMCGLMSGCRVRSDVKISGYQPRLGEQVAVQENRVGANYFSTVGMRLLDGRDFDSRDTASSPRVAIVNQAMARQYFSGRLAIGEKFGDDKPDIEIVGIVEDARVNSVREAAAPMAYYPMQQGVYYGSLEVRTAGYPQWMIAEVRKAVSEVEPNLPVGRITPLVQRVDSNLNQERLVVMLSSLFGVLALGLAAFGLYGVMSYAVSRRTAELGLRLALGSPRSLVLWMILKESLLLILLGLAVGLPVVLAASRLISGMLFDVNPHDAATLSAAVLILAVVAVLSAWAPAWRASRVNPMVALRYE